MCCSKLGGIFLLLLLCVQWRFTAAQATTEKPPVNNITSALVNQIADETVGLIRLGDKEIIQSAQHQDVVLVIGNTGAGKTTLAKFVTGKQLESYKQKFEVLIKDAENKISTVGTSVSKTIFPELFIDNETNTAYYDLPGFSDTRNASIELANAWFMRSVANHVARVKIMVIINHSSLVHGQVRGDFKTLLEHATSFILNPKKFENSIFLVASKVPAQMPAEDVIPDIADFINEQRPSLNEVFSEEGGKLSRVEQFVDAILKTDENETYTHIQFFQQPTDLGLLSGMPSMRLRRDKIKQMISNNTMFVAKNDLDFGISVSAKSTIYVRFIVDKLNVLFAESIEQLAQSLGMYYDLKIKNSTTVSSYIGKCFQELELLKGTTTLLENSTSRAEFIQILGDNLIATLPEYSNITAGLLQQDKTLQFYEILISRLVSPRVLEWIHPIKIALAQLQDRVTEGFTDLNGEFDRKIEEMAENIHQGYQFKCQNASQWSFEWLQTMEQDLHQDTETILQLTEELIEEMSFNSFIFSMVKNLIPIKVNVSLDVSKFIMADDIELKSAPELRPGSWKRHFYILTQQLSSLRSNLSQITAEKQNNAQVNFFNKNISALQRETDKMVAAAEVTISNLREQVRHRNATAAEMDAYTNSLRQNYSTTIDEFQERIGKLNETRIKAEEDAQKAQEDLDVYNNNVTDIEKNLENDEATFKDLEAKYKESLSTLLKTKNNYGKVDTETIIVRNYAQVPVVYDNAKNKCSSLCRKYGATSYTWCYLEQPAGSYWGYCSPPNQKYDYSKIKISSHGVPCRSKCSKGLLANGGYSCEIAPTKYGGVTSLTDYCPPEKGQNYKGVNCVGDCSDGFSGYYKRVCETNGEYVEC